MGKPTSAGSFAFTDEMRKKFEHDGMLVIENFFPAETADDLMEEAQRLLRNFDLAGHPMTRFVAGEDDNPTPQPGKPFQARLNYRDDYFLSSGDKIRFFFEEDAFDSKGQLTRPKELAINKIGHALHVLNQKFCEFSTSEAVKAVARGVGFSDARMIQSMVITKQPGIGGKVDPHQDSTFLYTDPVSAVGMWFALEDSTATNGALSFIPGSHKTTPIRRRMVRCKNGEVGFEELNGAQEPSVSYNESDWVIKEMRKGSMVLIHGSVLHKSEKNTSDKSRYAYTFHIIEGKTKYDEKNWLQAPPFMPLYDQ